MNSVESPNYPGKTLRHSPGSRQYYGMQIEPDGRSQISITRYRSVSYSDFVSLGCILAIPYTAISTTGMTIAALIPPPMSRVLRNMIIPAAPNTPIIARMTCMCSPPFLSLDRNHRPSRQLAACRTYDHCPTTHDILVIIYLHIS